MLATLPFGLLSHMLCNPVHQRSSIIVQACHQDPHGGWSRQHWIEYPFNLRPLFFFFFTFFPCFIRMRYLTRLARGTVMEWSVPSPFQSSPPPGYRQRVSSTISTNTSAATITSTSTTTSSTNQYRTRHYIAFLLVCFVARKEHLPQQFTSSTAIQLPTATSQQVTASAPPGPLPDGPPIKFCWGEHSGQDHKGINSSYEEVIHWKRNLFMVPFGSAGISFVKEISRLLRMSLAWNVSVWRQSLWFRYFCYRSPVNRVKPRTISVT